MPRTPEPHLVFDDDLIPTRTYRRDRPRTEVDAAIAEVDRTLEMDVMAEHRKLQPSDTPTAAQRPDDGVYHALPSVFVRPEYDRIPERPQPAVLSISPSLRRRCQVRWWGKVGIGVAAGLAVGVAAILALVPLRGFDAAPGPTTVASTPRLPTDIGVPAALASGNPEPAIPALISRPVPPPRKTVRRDRRAATPRATVRKAQRPAPRPKAVAQSARRRRPKQTDKARMARIDDLLKNL